MLALDPLGLPFTREGARRVPLSRIRTPVISVKTRNPKRLPKLFQFPQHGVFAPPKYRCQDGTAIVIDSMPQPR